MSQTPQQDSSGGVAATVDGVDKVASKESSAPAPKTEASPSSDNAASVTTAAQSEAAQNAAIDERARRKSRKRAEDPVVESDSSEEPTAESQGSPRWKAVKDYGVASDRNARFRRTMEDAHVAVDEFTGANSAYFGIYDGHGGRGAVNFVQEHLHVNFREQLNLGLDVDVAWLQAYRKTDEDMAAASNDVGYSGSTSATAFIQIKDGKRWLHTANCGDARIVLCRDGGKPQRLTQDHKGTDPAEVKRIQDAGGLVVLNRVSGILAVTRSLGDLKMKEFVIGDPYCETLEILPTDTHLVVACDGIWDVLSDQEVCDALLQPDESGSPPSAQALANRLLVQSLKAGTTDNVSVIVVILNDVRKE